MRIMHVLAPAEFGGLEEVVRLLASGQQRRGDDVVVAASSVAPATPHPFVDALRDGGVTVECSPVSGRAYAAERAWFRALCGAREPDIVHTHGLRADTLHAPVARELGIPGVATVHGITAAGWKSWLHHQLEWHELRRAEAVVAVSRPLVEALSARGVRREHIALIPNAYQAQDPPHDRDDARALLGIPRDAFVVGWAGRLSREKGADVLIDALAELADLPVWVSFVGDGPEREALAEQTRARRVSERVRWHGMIPNAGRLMCAFDVFALSSRSEGTPIALFEAMAAGVPIVATSVGGVPDVVSEREASVVPALDPGAFADAVRLVYGAPAAAAARASAAAQRLQTDFAVEPWIERYADLYRRLSVSVRTRERTAVAMF